MLTRWQTRVTSVHLLENGRRSFPSVRTFTGLGTTTSAVNNVGSMMVAMNVADKRLALSVNHGYLRIGTRTKKAKSQKLKRKAAAESKKLKNAMDDSVEIHAPEETLGPQEKSKKPDGSSHHKKKSKSDKPATESCFGRVQSQVAHPSRSDGTSRTKTGTDLHHRRSSDEDRLKDRYSSDRGSSRHWRNGDVQPIATAMTIEFHHHRQDVPVTEVGKGIQRQGRQLLRTLVATIQRDSRGCHGGLVLRAGIAVRRPSRQPLPCQGARPPAVLTRLVIQDHHNRHVNGVDVVQRINRYLRLRPHAGVRPQIDLDHPAVVRYVLSTYLRSLQSQFHQQA